MTRALAVLAMVAAGLACGPSARGGRRLRPTRGVVVARVAGEPVFAEEVAAVARERGITPRAAVDVVADELRLAREAERRALPGEAREDIAWRAAVQLLLRREIEVPLQESTLPPGDVAAVFDRRRAELAHRGLVRVVHVVALANADAGVGARDAARALITSLRARLIARGGEQPTEDIFRSEAARLPPRCCNLEALAPFDAEGRNQEGGRFVGEFARAAWALTTQHPLSEPFETSYGVHVALLLQRVPAMTRTDDEALAIVRRDMVAIGRSRRVRDMIGQLRLRERVEVSEATLRAVDRVARTASPGP